MKPNPISLNPCACRLARLFVTGLILTVVTVISPHEVGADPAPTPTPLSIPAPEFENPVMVPEVSAQGLDEHGPWVSNDGLRIYFGRDALSGSGVDDEIYMASRNTTSAPFGPAIVVQGLGSFSYKRHPWLTPDEKVIYFRTELPGVSDGTIRRAERASLDQPFTNLTSLDYLRTTVSATHAGAPTLTDDELRILYGANNTFYEATRTNTLEPFGSPVLLASLGQGYDPMMSGDGLRLFFRSNRAGGSGAWDIYYAERPDLTSPFSYPVNVTTVNTVVDEVGAFYHENLQVLFFVRGPASPPGGGEIFSASLKGAIIPTATPLPEPVVAPRFQSPVLIAEISHPSLNEGGMWVSTDGLRLYFTRDNKPGVGLDSEIYLSERASIDQPFGTPALVKGLGNSPYNSSPWLTPDEKKIYFRGSSSFADATLYHATRNALGEKFANLIELVYIRESVPGNRAYSPSLTPDELMIFFGADGDSDIYMATRNASVDQFNTPVSVSSLNTSYRETQPSISQNGLQLFFISNRPGSQGGFDIWYTRRNSLNDEFLPPAPVTTVSSSFEDWYPFLHEPTGVLYFMRYNPAVSDSADLYMALPEGDIPPTPTPILPSIVYVDITQDSGLDPFNHLEDTMGVAMADLDGDRALDIVRMEKYFTNDGSGHLNAGKTFPGLDDGRSVLGMTSGDYDNDGDPDILASLYDRGVALFRNDNGAFTDVSSTVNLQGTGQTYHSLFADFNNDGYLDIFEVNGGSSSPNLTTDALLLGSASGQFTDVSAGSGANLDTTGLWALAFDYDNDGDMDIYTEGFYPRSEHHLLRNDGSAHFTDVTASAGVGAPANEYGFADAGDYDNDGDFDLYVCNQGSLDILYRNNGNGSFTNVTTEMGLASPRNSWNVSFVDLNLDGYLDILLLSRSSTEPSHVLLNDRALRFVDISNTDGLGNLIGFAGHVLGDMDGDGDLDLFGVKANTQALYRLDLTSPGNYLIVSTVGTVSNRDGIGARIVAHAGGRQITRQVGGRLAESPEVELGLGSASIVNELKVYWPSGIVQTLSNVGVNQRITIVEPGTPWATPTPTPNVLNITLAAHIEPPAPVTTDDLECVTTITNPDNVAIDLNYRWFRNGFEILEGMLVDNEFLPVTGPTLSHLYTAKNETFYCNVEATDGFQSIFVNTLPVAIQNSPPTAPVVEIRPPEPMPGQDLGINILVYSTDPDGDAVAYRIDWYESENGGASWVHKLEFNNHAFISGIYLQVGDLWRVEITPYEVPVNPAKAGTHLVEGEAGWDQVYIGANNRPVVAVLTPDTGHLVASPGALIQWQSSDEDGDTVKVDLYYDTDAVKGGAILIATDLPASGVMSWTPPSMPAGLMDADLSADGAVSHQDLFMLAHQWQNPSTGQGYHIFARAWDSKGAMSEGFSPGEVIVPLAFPANTSGLLQLLDQWHATE